MDKRRYLDVIKIARVLATVLLLQRDTMTKATHKRSRLVKGLVKLPEVWSIIITAGGAAAHMVPQQ